ncbi:MAG: hypothetical protein SOI20_05455, partial [Eubacteriales bacterium]
LQNHLPASLRSQEAPLRGVCSFQNLSVRVNATAIFETCAFFCKSRTFGFCMCFTVQFSRNCVLLSFVTTNDILSLRAVSVNSFLILFSEEF